MINSMWKRRLVMVTASTLLAAGSALLPATAIATPIVQTTPRAAHFPAIANGDDNCTSSGYYDSYATGYNDGRFDLDYNVPDDSPCSADSNYTTTYRLGYIQGYNDGQIDSRDSG